MENQSIGLLVYHQFHQIVKPPLFYVTSACSNSKELVIDVFDLKGDIQFRVIHIEMVVKLVLSYCVPKG